MIRPDLSNSLIHLTRDHEGGLTSEQSFDKIIAERKLLGSTNDVRGEYKVIALSETPISAIGQITAQKHPSFRYGPFGFLFTKKFLYEKGARPVIYQPEGDYKLLPEELQYRHVRYEIEKSDWTWEREWRLKIDELELEPESVTLIVRDRTKVEQIKKRELSGIDTLSIATDGFITGKKLEWHFIALSDLGF